MIAPIGWLLGGGSARLLAPLFGIERMGTAYRQTINGCLAETIGAAGLSDEELRLSRDKAAAAVEWLRAAKEAGEMPLLALPERRDDLDDLSRVARRMREDWNDLVILGTGGSSLGAETLVRLFDRGFGDRALGPRCHFLDNLDPYDMWRALRHIDLRKCGFLVVSKSGTTAETLAQMLAAMSRIIELGAEEYLDRHFIVITEPGPSPLRRLAEARGFPILDHDPNLAGRFSVLSLVGLLPAMALGLDPARVRDGAARVLDDLFREGAAAAPAEGAALAVALAERKGVRVNVLMAYAERLRPFTRWYAQLWAESLGKGGKGTTALAALGPVDQHSQLQLFLDGPRDKYLTFVTLDVAGEGDAIGRDLARDPDLAYLRGRTIGDLVAAEQRAVMDSLIAHDRPVRELHLPRLDEAGIGALLMHFMLETAIAGHILGVEVFTQPAVDDAKARTREILKATAGETAAL